MTEAEILENYGRSRATPTLPVILDWYKTLPKKAREALSLAHLHGLAKALRGAPAERLAGDMSPEAYDRAPKHRYWGAGEPDCPRDIKAGNGELHTLRCKICGLDDPRNPICHADKHFEAARPS